MVALWRQCNLVRPTNDPHKDIRRKLRVRPDLFLVGLLEGKIVASVMAGYEGHRGWLNYVAVAPEHQRSGVGRALMEEAERLLRAEGCPKINLQVRTVTRPRSSFIGAWVTQSTTWSVWASAWSTTSQTEQEQTEDTERACSAFETRRSAVNALCFGRLIGPQGARTPARFPTWLQLFLITDH